MTFTKDDEVIFRGCSPIEHIINPSPEIEELLNYLNNLPMIKKKYCVSRMNLKDILIDAQYFLNGHFKLHNIPFIKEYNTLLLKRKTFKIKKIHPYQLPITFVKDSAANGRVEEIFIPGKEVLFRSLGIGETLCELSSSSYIHEITHTQLDSLIGSYDNYFNQEVLSIFLELFHSSLLSPDENILRLEECNRVYELTNLTKQQKEFFQGEISLSRDDQIDNSKYIQSDLIALHLFSKFYFAKGSIKREMLSDIQKIFNGIITVEEYLAKYEVSFANSQDKKVLTKYLYRQK